MDVFFSLRWLRSSCLGYGRPSAHHDAMQYNNGTDGASQGISAVVICFNEEDRIGSCLSSVAWCDEIVVVDSFSTDETVKICERYTRRIIQRPWTGYGDQIAFAVGQARQQWVLLLDADERVTPELKEEIRDVLLRCGHRVEGFALPRLVHYLGRDWRRGGWYPDYKVKLFRRDLAVFGGSEPHPKIILNGPVQRLKNPLRHFSYRHIADHMDRINRYTTISSITIKAQGRRWRAADAILHPVARFLRFYVWKRGFLEGFPGLFVAASAAYYVFLKYAKLWELESRERVEAEDSWALDMAGVPAQPKKTRAVEEEKHVRQKPSHPMTQQHVDGAGRRD